jgi:hypothetical protein
MSLNRYLFGFAVAEVEIRLGQDLLLLTFPDLFDLFVQLDLGSVLEKFSSSSLEESRDRLKCFSLGSLVYYISLLFIFYIILLFYYIIQYYTLLYYSVLQYFTIYIKVYIIVLVYYIILYYIISVYYISLV